MSIQAELNRLTQAKSDIKAAIEAKGVPVSDGAKLEEYPAAIARITTGEVQGAQPPVGYRFENVTVTADGVDVTSEVFVDGRLYLDKVTGHIELSLDINSLRLPTPEIGLVDYLDTPEIELVDE